ncbi:MAG: helicase-exonuclease AddAB subunit AddB [Clostridiales bacterium]|nr:helicase-exonuclease AddAB subunit AddB [Clostridiales bacterium]
MSLEFLVGGSGAGKTTLLYDEVIRGSMEDPAQQYFIIVPEQFSLQTQKDIVTRHPNHATMNIDIVSFRRLAYRVFAELAIRNPPVLDDMGKSMVLRRAAGIVRRKLSLFSGHLGQAGFVSQMKSMLSECRQYGVTPEILGETAAKVRSPLLRLKLEDFAVVYREFQDYIEGHYITSEDVLDVLCRFLPDSRMVRDSVVVLDGFTGFTPVQYRLLELMMVYAKRVVATVTADPGISLYRDVGMQELFHMSRQMAIRLSKLAEKNQVRRLPDRVIDRRAGGSEIAWLERHLFRYPCEPYPGEATGSVELLQAASPSEEVAQICHRILALIREGLRYRDIAVITGDLSAYGKEITHQFGLHGIPCFLDDKRTVMDHPLVELIRSALEAVRWDFSYESVFRCLRQGFLTDDREMTDRMENYVIALGIRGGKRWREPWERTYRGGGQIRMEELNAFKDDALAPLFAMQDAMGAEGITIAGMVLAVKNFLLACRAEEYLAGYQKYFEEIGELRLAGEYGQVYGLVTGLLDRVADLLGSETVSRKEFMEILDAGFAELSVGAIPATVDQVMVGDITRTRLAHIRVLFFVGVNDGIVPTRNDGGGILTDRERETLAELSVELSPTAREDSFQQRFYLYLMMTKPSDQLFLSFARTGNDGKSRRPSYLIAELTRMFPQIPVRETEKLWQETGREDPGLREEEGEPSALYSLEEAKAGLAEGLLRYRDSRDASGTEAFLELCRFFLASDELAGELRSLADAAFYIYEEKGIGHAVARALYGSLLEGSVTRLEQYAACAYGHFLRYGLELAERERYELEASDLGNLFHESINRCFQWVMADGRDWRSVTDEERRRLVRDVVANVTAEYGNTILASSSRNAWLAKRVEKITQRTVWALQQQIIKGDFSPAGFEVTFSESDHLKAMRIPLSREEALQLRGRIDRLDLCRDGDTVYVKIIDYKSGGTSFDLLALYYGLQMQLVVYLDAAMELAGRRLPGCEVEPAGIFYYHIADPLIARDGEQTPEEIDEAILRQLRMNGLVNSELPVIRHLDHTIQKESDIIPVVLKDGEVLAGRSSVASGRRFAALRKYVRGKLGAMGREILDGEIGVKPYRNGTRTACDYCPYHAVCGFDRKTEGFDYRRWKQKKPDEIWEEIDGGEMDEGAGTGH